MHIEITPPQPLPSGEGKEIKRSESLLSKGRGGKEINKGLNLLIV